MLTVKQIEVVHFKGIQGTNFFPRQTQCNSHTYSQQIPPFTQALISPHILLRSIFDIPITLQSTKTLLIFHRPLKYFPQLQEFPQTSSTRHQITIRVFYLLKPHKTSPPSPQITYNTITPFPKILITPQHHKMAVYKHRR